MRIFPPIHDTLTVPAVQALLGTPLRLYSFGDAGPGPVAKPYVLWQTVGGEPENYLGDRPEVDRFTVQVDVYADSAQAARAVTQALLNELEAVAHVISWNGEFRDTETRDFRLSFSLDWWVYR